MAILLTCLNCTIHRDKSFHGSSTRRERIPLLISLLTAVCSVIQIQGAIAQTQILGMWEGAIVLPGMNLGIAVTFERQGDSLAARIDIPQQGAKALPLRSVSFANPAVHFELPAGPGLATFQGTLKGDSVKGEFRQAGFQGSFFLGKSANPSPPAVDRRPPYREEEVRFQNGDISLAGTLTFPQSGGPFPALVLITGSGSQNRDEELFGFRPFWVIADHLTRKGFAVLRYDDRGVGGSSAGPSAATTADFAEDALAGIAILKQRKDIKRGEIGLMGHSEGSVAAGIAASKSKDVAFVVLMAGSAVPGEKIVLYQIEAIERAGGDTRARDRALT